MAKTKNEDEDQSLLSEESIALLEDVKKGKARRYAMICKGTAIISLVVFRRGTVESHKKEAKQIGKGQFYHGIVDGKGQDIRFVLSIEDGFDSPPVKNTVLKAFLVDEAGVKCKPRFEVLPVAPAYTDDEETPNAPTSSPGNNTSQAGVTSSTPSSVESAATDPRAYKLSEALLRLTPQVNIASEQFPQYQAELQSNLGRVGEALSTGQIDQAQTEMLSLARLLKSLSQSGNIGDTNSGRPKETNNPSTDTSPDNTTTSDVTEDNPFQQLYEGLLSNVPADVQQLKQSNPTAAEKLQKVVDGAAQLAHSGKFEQAFQYLSEAATVIARLTQTTRTQEVGESIPEGIVDQRVRELQRLTSQWQQVRLSSIDGLEDLTYALRQSDDYDLMEISDRIQELVERVPAHLDAALAELSQALESRGNPKAIEYHKSVIAEELKQVVSYLTQYRDAIDNCEQNPFGIQVEIRKPFVETMKEIQVGLKSLTNKS